MLEKIRPNSELEKHSLSNKFPGVAELEWHVGKYRSRRVGRADIRCRREKMPHDWNEKMKWEDEMKRWNEKILKWKDSWKDACSVRKSNSQTTDYLRLHRQTLCEYRKHRQIWAELDEIGLSMQSEFKHSLTSLLFSRILNFNLPITIISEKRAASTYYN